MTKKRIGILTGGGDVPPLNAFIASAKEASVEYGVELIGFIKGWLGVVENQFVDLMRINLDPLIGGTILKSSRINLEKISGGIETALENLQKVNLDALIVVGGEDTLSNSFCLPKFPQILISKTIDNDVGIIDSAEIVNYFTLGFPTAAKRIATLVSLKEGVRTTAYSHERIVVLESMGMHAGWLALASSMGHPDFIIIPEFPLNYAHLKKLIIERYKANKNVIVVIAEGARFQDGSYVSADENEKDDFGHPRLIGAAVTLSKKLKEDLKNHFDTRNVNGVNPSYLYRSGTPSSLDLCWAEKLGKEAIRLLSQSFEASIFLTVKKETKGFSVFPYPLSNFKGIRELHRVVDKRFYNHEEYAVTEEGRKYLAEIVEEIAEQTYGLG